MNRFLLALLANMLAVSTALAMGKKPPPAPPAASSAAPSAASAPAVAASAATPAATAASAPAQAASGSTRTIEVVTIDDADPALMQAAFKKAQDTLDDFLTVVNKHDPKIINMAVKIRVKEGKLTDYFWIVPFTQTETGFKGEASNDGQVITEVQVGREVIFNRSHIVDWMYVDTTDKTMHGNFTTCALMAKAPPAEIKEMKSMYGLDCSKP